MVKSIAINLFCGCSGLSWGFKKAGVEVRLDIDCDDIFLKTFKNNHGNTEVLEYDICGPVPDEVKCIDPILPEQAAYELVSEALGRLGFPQPPKFPPLP